MIATASKPIRKRRQTRARRCTFKNAYTRFFSRVQYGPNLYQGYYAQGLALDPMGTAAGVVPPILDYLFGKFFDKVFESVEKRLAKKVTEILEEPAILQSCASKTTRKGNADYDYDLTQRGDHESAELRQAVEKAANKLLKEFNKKKHQIENDEGVKDAKFWTSYRLIRRHSVMCNIPLRKVAFRRSYIATLTIHGEAKKVPNLEKWVGEQSKTTEKIGDWLKGGENVFGCCCE